MNALFEACTAAYSAADLNAIFEYQLHERWLKLWMNDIFEYQLLELWFAQQLNLKLIWVQYVQIPTAGALINNFEWMQFSNTNCMSSDLHSSWFECNFRSWFECNFRIPTAWALIKTLNECNFRIPTAWALICIAAYSEADLNAMFKYQLHELWFAQQLI